MTWPKLWFSPLPLRRTWRLFVPSTVRDLHVIHVPRLDLLVRCLVQLGQFQVPAPRPGVAELPEGYTNWVLRELVIGE